MYFPVSKSSNSVSKFRWVIALRFQSAELLRFEIVMKHHFDADHFLTTSGELPVSISLVAFIPFLVAGVAMAAAYGSSFLLAEHLATHNFDTVIVGKVISCGIATTLISCFFAGRLAQRLGVLEACAVAAGSMVIAMLCFAAIAAEPRAAFLGGLLLGVGWSVFFVLSPLQLIHYLHPSSRIQYLTVTSGAQMAGLGLAPPVGHFLARQYGSFSSAYVSFAVLCGVAIICLFICRQAMKTLPHLPQEKMAVTFSDLLAIFHDGTVFPVLMIILAACAFSGLSTYQSLYAESRGLHPDTFFLTFTATSVFLRFGLARSIGRMNALNLAATLFALTAVSLLVFIINANHSSLYVLSTFLFACGYGLSYSTLNGLAVNQSTRTSIAATSQIFTSAYFVGLFGFPYLGGSLINFFGMNAMILALIATAIMNVALIFVMRSSFFPKFQYPGSC